MVKSPKKGVPVKLKVGAATGPVPQSTVTVTAEALGKAVNLIGKESHTAMVSAIKDMPAAIEKELGKSGITKQGLLDTAATMGAHHTPVPVGAPKPPPPPLSGMLGQMEQVTNPSTNSSFFVVGRLPNGLRLSLRFWANPNGTNSGSTMLNFRLRVGDQDPVGAPAYVELTNVLAFCNTHFPGYGFSATAVKSPTTGMLIYPHASVEGMLSLPVGPHDKAGLLEHVVGSTFGKELYNLMASTMNATMDYTPVQFEEFLKAAVLHAVIGTATKPAPKQPVVYKLGQSGTRLLDSEAKSTKKSLLADAGL